MTVVDEARCSAGIAVTSLCVKGFECRSSSIMRLRDGIVP
jgi:hypothetical protein